MPGCKINRKRKCGNNREETLISDVIKKHRKRKTEWIFKQQ